jgi:RimJ/RimL family protein N-acetyltransferase
MIRISLAACLNCVPLPDILAITTTGNLRSQAVMRRIGMTHHPADDFDDPSVPGEPPCRNVLYRIRH